MARLYVDKDLLVSEFRAKLIEQIHDSQKELESDIRRNITFHEYEPDVSTELEDLREKLIIHIKGNAALLFDSYGSGSLMDWQNNPLIGEYLADEAWNPHRSLSDTTIRGRPAGAYTDVFGNERVSSGALEGQPLEGRKISNKSGTGRTYTIEPREGTHAIELAIKWYKENLPSMISNAYKNMNFSKCMVYR